MAASPGAPGPAVDAARGRDPVLAVRDLVVERAGRRVFEVDAFLVDEGETVAVVGPNGAGKSTLLLALGTLLPAAGVLRFRGRPVERRDALAYRRRLGLVLAAPLLLDATVRENVAAGLRFRGLPRSEVDRRSGAWLERLGVGHLAARRAREVSSGEAQRISLARALVLEPDILLLDEPFASVDPAMRLRLVDDLERILAETGVACVVVTHDLEEAVRLGDRLAVVVDGRVRQVDRPERVLASPVDEAVAQFVGVETRLPGRVRSASGAACLVAVDGATIEATGVAEPGRDVLCCLRPEDITLAPLRTGAGDDAADGRPVTVNHLTGRIERIVPQGPIARVTVNCGTQLVAILTRSSIRDLGLVEGATVDAAFASSSVHVIDRQP